MKWFLSLGVLALALLPQLFAIWSPGFFITDDGDWMVIRLAAFYDTWRQGQFPVRFLYNLNHGYGYPVTNFLYPFPFYLGSLIHLIGLNFVDSVKMITSLAILGGALGMFLLAKNKFNNLFSATVSALIYCYLPYKLFDLYVRGSLGELVALGIAPFVFYFWERIKAKRSGVIFGSLSVGLLITSHNTLALLFLGLFILMFLLELVHNKTKIIPFPAIGMVLLGLGLSSFFWIPAIFELQFTRASLIAVSEFENYFLTTANFSQVVGISAVTILIISLIVWARTRFRENGALLFFAILSIVALSSISSPFWSTGPLPRLVQFPWRFASLTIFLLALLGGWVTTKQRLVGVGLSLLTIFFGVTSFSPQRSFRLDSYYSTNDDTTTVKNEYMPKWVTSDPKNRADTKFISASKGVIEANIVYYPGWQAQVSQRTVPVNYNENGLITFDGELSDVTELIFKETPLRQAANLLSLAAVFSLIVLFTLKRRII